MNNEKLLEDLFKAYYDARRNKRNTISQLKFELRLEDNLLDLYHRLLDRTYRPGRSIAFIIEKPVKREIFAADFADRVVHHLYQNYTNEIFERSFIDDCYSCRKGKGTLYGIQRLEHHIRSCSQNYTQKCYVLKLDISGYFMSINRALLGKKIEETLHTYYHRKDAEGRRFSSFLDYDLILFLSQRISSHDSTTNCVIKGNLADWEGLPADKSLFRTSSNCGLPIGNLTSQIFSNVYLNELDHYVKRTLKVAHYGRYVDDMYFVDRSKKRLASLINAVCVLLKERLGLVLHPRKVYLQEVHRGVAFLGVFIKPYRRYAGWRITQNFKQALSLGASFYGKDVEALRQVINSYLGYLIHHHTYRLRRAILLKSSWIFDFVCVNVGFCLVTLCFHCFPPLLTSPRGN